MLAPVSAGAASLTVTVANVDPKGGDLHVALYTEDLWKSDDAEPVAGAIVPALAPQTVVTLKDIKPGVYGIKMYQDTNRNGEFDQNLIGLPLERYGFSRDAKPVLSEPGFDKTKFTIHEGPNTITVHLQ
jgi:uncharacterized protein (DUF2141 family)